MIGFTINLHADASFCPDTRAAGWGIYAKANGREIERSGVFKVPVRTPIEAEIGAICIGMIAVERTFDPTPKSQVIIASDCKPALRAIRDHMVSGYAEMMVDRMTEVVDERNLILVLRHVPGHSRGRDTDSIRNNTCDRMAHARMQEARRILKGDLS